ncbi:MAG: AMP-binding protein [Tenacibaculum sp.]|nr:AMP-binding protein [Tenacibaculum sp.]
MNNLKIHKDFKLNGKSFFSEEELLNYSKGISNSVYCFFKEWFSKYDFIEVKTSGSTGKQKIISLKKEFMINSAKATGEFFNLPEKTTALLCLSTDFIAGKMMLVRAIVLGWELDVIGPISKIKINENYDFSAMVPLQLRNSLSEIYKIKKLIVGGGVVSNDLLEKIQNIPTEIFATYGMTETITHIAVKKLSNCTNFQQKYYKILPNIKIYIDERRCLIINAPNISENVIKTNDIVDLISDTQFEWLGRFDNVINSGGIKLYPEKIEGKLSKIIKNRFFVIGIPDDVLGEKLVLITEGNNQEINLKSVDLLKYEIPKEIYFVEHFVETETKKIQRKKTLDLIKL